MKERPILFSGPMVRALLAGRKTQTRRVVKSDWWRCLDPEDSDDRVKALAMCPYGAPGDRLWVRETFGSVKGNGRRTVFRADGDPYRSDGSTITDMKWKPSIFMPRHESRLTLEVTEVRVERVQDISDEDAIAEGLIPVGGPHGQQMWAYSETAGGHFADPSVAFQMLWRSINGVESWAANPYVWVVSFKAVGQ